VRSVRATVATALVELLGGAALWVWWLTRFRLEYYAATQTAPGETRVDVAFGYGALMFLSFAVSLRGLVASFIVVEGAARLLHAVFTEEPIGFLVPAVARALARRWRAWRSPPPPDRVARRDDGAVIVEGVARDWGPLSTFVVDGAFFTLAERAPLASGLVRYTLRPASDRHLVRNLVRLDVP
jgi:hypothetical protein